MTTRPMPTTVHEMEQGPPYENKLKRKVYEKELRELQIEMLKLQRYVKETGERIVILFEGRDAAGKGGSIKRFTEHLNPRGGTVVALSKPDETERNQWYFQRYVAHLPTAGEIVMFDRSWYNRAGVERVMGFCSSRDLAVFLRQVGPFESGLVDSGLRLFKLWFTVSQDEQHARFADRRRDPLRRWKLSPIDEASIDRFDDYTAARDEMLLATDTPVAPWTVINSNEKRRSRLESIRVVLDAVTYPTKDIAVVRQPDPYVTRPASELI